jgi:hypothetical protein
MPTVVLPQPISPLTIAARSPRSASSSVTACTTSACAWNSLRLRTGQHELAMRPGLAGVDGWIGAVERIQQLVAELGDEILKAQGQGRSGRFEQVALDGRAIGGGTTSVSRDMVMLQRRWGMHLPLRGDGMPGVGREERREAAVEEQIDGEPSGNSDQRMVNTSPQVGEPVSCPRHG